MSNLENKNQDGFIEKYIKNLPNEERSQEEIDRSINELFDLSKKVDYSKENNNQSTILDSIRKFFGLGEPKWYLKPAFAASLVLIISISIIILLFEPYTPDTVFVKQTKPKIDSTEPHHIDIDKQTDQNHELHKTITEKLDDMPLIVPRRTLFDDGKSNNVEIEKLINLSIRTTKKILSSYNIPYSMTNSTKIESNWVRVNDNDKVESIARLLIYINKPDSKLDFLIEKKVRSNKNQDLTLITSGKLTEMVRKIKKAYYSELEKFY